MTQTIDDRLVAKFGAAQNPREAALYAEVRHAGEALAVMSPRLEKLEHTVKTRLALLDALYRALDAYDDKVEQMVASRDNPEAYSVARAGTTMLLGHVKNALHAVKLYDRATRISPEAVDEDSLDHREPGLGPDAEDMERPGAVVYDGDVSLIVVDAPLFGPMCIGVKADASVPQEVLDSLVEACPFPVERGPDGSYSIDLPIEFGGKTAIARLTEAEVDPEADRSMANRREPWRTATYDPMTPASTERRVPRY